jgi:hypothetical protein
MNTSLSILVYHYINISIFQYISISILVYQYINNELNLTN